MAQALEKELEHALVNMDALVIILNLKLALAMHVNVHGETGEVGEVAALPVDLERNHVQRPVNAHMDLQVHVLEKLHLNQQLVTWDRAIAKLAHGLLLVHAIKLADQVINYAHAAVIALLVLNHFSKLQPATHILVMKKTYVAGPHGENGEPVLTIITTEADTVNVWIGILGPVLVPLNKEELAIQLRGPYQTENWRLKMSIKF